MSDPSVKKKALANFFGKKKKAADDGPAADEKPKASSSLAGLPAVGIGGDWDNDSTAVASVLGLAAPISHSASGVASRMGKMGLSEVTEEEMNDTLGESDGIPRVDLEAEEAKKALWAAVKKNDAKKKAAAPAPAPVPESTAPKPTSFAEQMAMKRAGQLAPAPLHKGQDMTQALKSSAAFPTLGRAASGLPPGAKLAEPEQNMAEGFKSKNAWAALAAAAADEEEEEEARERERAEEQAAEEAAAAPAPAPAAAPEPAPAAAAAPVDPSTVTEADLVRGADAAPALADERAFEKAAKKIVEELATSRDVGEALVRLQEELKAADASATLRLRQKAVEAIIQAGLDADSAALRVDIGLLLARAVVPGKVVTSSALSASFSTFLEIYEDLAVDMPKANHYLAEMLTGVSVASADGSAANRTVKAGDIRGVVAQGIVDAASLPKAVADVVTQALATTPTGVGATAGAGAGAADADADKKKKKKAAIAF